MGTYAIIRKLQGYWTARTHPIYRLEGRQVNSITWYRRLTHTRFGKTGILTLIIVIAIISAIWHPFGFLVEGLGVLSCLGFVLFVLYLWPVILGVTVSSVIAAERERQTWDTLLTTPYDWGDLLLAKLASLLRNRKPFPYTFLWTVTTLGHITLNACTWNRACFAQQPDIEAPLLMKGAILIILLVATGYQLYVLSMLGGVLATLVAGSRSSARAAAGLFTLGIVIFVQLGVLFLQQTIGALQFGFTRPSPPDQLITGCITLGILMLIGEVAIRRTFAALTRHLGDGAISYRENL